MKNKIAKEKSPQSLKSEMKPKDGKGLKPKAQGAIAKPGTNLSLKGTELNYRSLFDNMLNGFACCKMIFEQGQPVDFIYLDVNDAFESLTGLKNVVGKKVSEVIPGIRKTDPELFEIYGRVARSGKPERFEMFVEALKMWFLVSVYSPEAEYFVAVFDVITERKKAEDALHESENIFRGFLEQSADAILLTNEQGEVIQWSKGAEILTGYSREESLGSLLWDIQFRSEPEEFKSQETYARIKASLQEVLLAGQGKILNRLTEATIQRPDGIRLMTQAVAFTIETNKGFLLGSILRDITESKRAEELVQASEARYKGLFEDSPISLWEEDFSLVKLRLDALREGGLTDIEEYFISHPEAVIECAALVKVLDVNKATMRLYGADRKEDILPDLAKIFEGKPGQVFRYELVNIAEGKTRFDWEGINKTLDGRLINIDLSWSAAPGYEQTLSRVIVSVIDITERKRVEEALRESEARFRGLFEDSPIALWEEDFSAVKQRLDALREEGITDFQEYFKLHPEAAAECASLLKFVDFNKAAIHLLGANNKEELFMALPGRIKKQRGQEFRKELTSIAEGKTHFGWEGNNITLDGRLIDIDLNWSAAPGYETSLSKVIVSMIDITERKRSEERIRHQLERLAALRAIDQVITSSFDLRNSLTMILNQATRELGVDAADVLLLNNANLFLEYNTGVGFRTKAAEKASVRLGQNYAGRVALERQRVQIPNLNDQPDDFLLKTVLAGENFICYFGVPLVAKGIVKGVLEVYHRTPLHPDQEWFDFLHTLADQAAIAIDNAHMFDNLQRSNIELTLAYDATIEGWSRAMDLRDRETEGHTLRVTDMTIELAGLFGIKDEDLVSIRRGALLHDIGKMGVPDTILFKSSTLTDEEWVLMRKHPTLAFEMLSSIRYLKSAIDIPYCHHERWDGTGYPRGLKGELIPLPARIFAIVDVWDAVTSDRPYRKAWSKEKAIEYLKSQAGRHFDPQIVQVCLESGVFDRMARTPPVGHR